MATSNRIRIPPLATGKSNELRLILLGRTGAGKSSFDNVILNDETFDAETSPIPVTTKCTTGCRSYKGKDLFVVDTPGFLDNRTTEDEIKTEVAKAYELTAVPGPNAFLLVIEPTRFLPQEAQAIEYLSKIFGSQAVNHTILVFTHAENFRKTTIQDYLNKLDQHSPLRKLVEQCHHRYLTVNSYGSEKDKENSIDNLLETIDNLLKTNGNQVYRSDDFDAIAKGIEEAKLNGTYQPIQSDGTFQILPQTKKILIDGRLRRPLARRTVES